MTVVSTNQASPAEKSIIDFTSDNITLEETSSVGEQALSNISIASAFPNNTSNLFYKFLKLISPALDRILGINKLRDLYTDNGLVGLEKQAFVKKLISALGVSVDGAEALLKKIPKTGRCIVVCNHPYGMIEGVIIAYLLTKHRSNCKIMANIGLKVFKEISSYFIFANPLKPKSVMNTTAIKQCFTHLESEGLLVVFPAGRVSFYQAEKHRVTDGQWNRLAVNLAKKTGTPILPVFISGTNSQLFHQMGRIYYRFRLMMLAREMFKLQQHKITFKAGNLLSAKSLNRFSSLNSANDYVRAQCYSHDPNFRSQWLEDDIKSKFSDVLSATPVAKIKYELVSLPEKQCLLSYKSFSVYYGYQHQIPACVREITRLREITFRTLNEGSGKACDTDKFDASYMHLFVFDNESEEIIGAYRIGQTDLLQQQGSLASIYLSQMFNFSADFVNRQQPCLEMGRSFITASHQNSFYGLLLLWKGIGAFVCQNPRYRTLYGTVSLSKLYDTRSVALINEVMVNETSLVTAKTSFSGVLHPEVKEFVQHNSLTIEQLSTFISGIETDGKEVPILLKQYHKLGAKFHCVGIDSNFNHTPGLLLSVDLPNAPDKLLNLYLGKGKEAYLQG